MATKQKRGRRRKAEEKKTLTGIDKRVVDTKRRPRILRKLDACWNILRNREYYLAVVNKVSKEEDQITVLSEIHSEEAGKLVLKSTVMTLAQGEQVVQVKNMQELEDVLNGLKAGRHDKRDKRGRFTKRRKKTLDELDADGTLRKMFGQKGGGSVS